MKLLLDARKLGDGGIGRYIENLLDGFYSIPDLEVTAIITKQSADKLKDSWRTRYSFRISNLAKYSLAELFSGGGRGFDLFHVPHYTLPFFTKCKTVVTVHDLIHIQFPEKPYYPLVAMPLIKSALSRAHGIITVSEYSRQVLINLNPSSEVKTKYIPNAVSWQLKSQAYDQTKKNIKKTHIFAVFSNSKPHKAPNDLIKAFEIFVKSNTGSLPLVIAGKGSKNLKIPPAIKDRVIILGEIDDDKLAEYYKSAFSVVIPSLLEGFCLQIIEAHANGTRCVVRPVKPIDELTTKHDIVAEDNTIESLANAIIKSINEPALEKVNFDLSKYNVDLVARQTYEYYKKIIGAPSSARHAGIPIN